LAAVTGHLGEEVVVARLELPLLHEDLVELAAVEPDAAALGARVDEDVRALDLDEPGAVVRATERFAAHGGQLTNVTER
jgi:hypothetical protein